MKPIKKIILGCVSALVVIAVVFCFLLFYPLKLNAVYSLTVKPGQAYGQTVRMLDENGAIRSRHVMLMVSSVMGTHKQLKPGMYRIQGSVSTWDIIKHLQIGHPDRMSVTIVEGMTFTQFRNRVNKAEGLNFETKNLSESQLLQKISAPHEKGEGLLFPDTYIYNWGDTDLSLYKQAYERMQEHLNEAWENRQENLPYQNPYELLTMASIVEKETAHENDRAKVAAVFVNRLNIGMKLQTDPTVIYGMGDRYKGVLYRSEWKRDSPYNTYTRHGLTPTPIALPGKKALEAAANPSDDKYLYFVSRMDGTGLSQFSHTLDEHNRAIEEFIRKRKKK